jgi:arginine repressor
MVTTDTATIDTRTNIGGTDGTARIIGTITIETMIATTTGIDALLILFSDNKFRDEALGSRRDRHTQM